MSSLASAFVFVVAAFAGQEVRIDASLDEALREAVAGRALDVHQALILGEAHAPLAWVAENPHAGVRARFDSDGVAIEVDAASGEPLRVAMTLESWGAPSHPQSAARAIVAASGASVTLERGELIEWYHNGIDGLAQGFTVLSAPENTAENGLELRMRVDGDLTADVQGDDRLVWRDECGQARLSYSGLRAWDQTGRDLDARLIAAGEWLSILVDDSDALYPITIDPLIATLEAKLTFTGAPSPRLLGYRVDLDGDRAVAFGLSAPAADVAAFVFARSGTNWAFEARVDGTSGSAESLGDVALSGDSLAFAANTESSTLACFHIFDRVGNVWEESLTTCSTDIYTTLGMAISIDNGRIAVTDNQGGPRRTRVYRLTPGSWVVEAVFVPGGGVSVRDDLLVVSTNPAPTFSNPQIRVYQRAGTTWSLLATPLLLPDGVYPVAIDEEHTIAVGAPKDNDAGVGAGAVFLLRRVGATWVLWEKLLSPSFPSSAGFGTSIAFSGGTLIIGCPRDDSAANDAGAAYVFRRNRGWSFATQLLAPDAAADDRFGTDVGVHDERVIVGTPQDDDQATNSGSAYVFTLESDAEVYCTAKVNSAGCLPEIQFNGTPSASSSAPFLISVHSVINNKLGLFFYGFGGRAALPFEGGVRCTPYPIRRTPTQLSGGSAGPDDCSGSYALDFNARIQIGLDANLVAGARVNGQFWSRDSVASFGVGLSDAIEFVIRP